MFEVLMDPDIYRLATLIILFLFFVVGVDSIGGSLSREPARGVTVAPRP